MTKFSSRLFSLPYVHKDLGVSYNSLRNHFEVKIMTWQRIEKIFLSAFILTPSFLGYFFVPGPLGDLNGVSWDVSGSTDSIKSF